MLDRFCSIKQAPPQHAEPTRPLSPEHCEFTLPVQASSSGFKWRQTSKKQNKAQRVGGAV